MATPEPKSVPGDFYVDSNCCTSCGVPQAVAPDLVGWTNEKYTQCYWKKQPENQSELQQAFAIFDGQELGCHRYKGSDPEIQRRIGFENCDHLEGVAHQGIRRWGPIWENLTTETDAQTSQQEGLFHRLWSRLLRHKNM